MCILHAREIKKSNTPPFLTPPSNKRPGSLSEDVRFTVMLLTSEQNEHAWCLHQACLTCYQR